MAKQKRLKNKSENGWHVFIVGRRTVRFITDKVVVFNMMDKLHGRFWGVAGLSIMLLGLIVCLVIRPDLILWSTAFSEFGRDVRTAPYLAVSLFFGAYGLWRWRRYLKHTLKHSRPVISLLGITVTGFYIAALMPIAWEPLPYQLHVFGVALAGIGMASTVVVDTLLTRTRKYNGATWRLIRLLSFVLILVGGYITFGSNSKVLWYNLSLLGELLMFLGYGLWVIDKTYRGEGARSRLSKILGRVVIVD